MLSMRTSEVAAELIAGAENVGETMVVETTFVDVFVSAVDEVEVVTVVTLIVVGIIDVTIKVEEALGLLDPVPGTVTV